MNYSLIYYLLWIFLYSIWFSLGIRTKLKTTTKNIEKNKISRYLLVFLLLLSLALISISTDDLFFRDNSNRYLKLTGILTILSGSIIALWARLILNDNWSGKVQILEGQQMIQFGLYGIVRHPIYLGFSLCFIGSFLFKLNLSTLLALFIMIPLHIIKAKQEENILIKEFGSEYSAYMIKTKRLIPFIY